MAVIPDWHRIAQVSDVQNGDMAKMLIQTMFAMALMYARDGKSVTLNLKIGQLMLIDGKVRFTSAN